MSTRACGLPVPKTTFVRPSASGQAWQAIACACSVSRGMCGFFMSASFVGGRFSSGDRATPRSESRRSFGNGPDGRKLAAAYTYNRGRRWLNPMAISCWMVPADTAMSSMVTASSPWEPTMVTSSPICGFRRGFVP